MFAFCNLSLSACFSVSPSVRVCVFLSVSLFPLSLSSLLCLSVGLSSLLCLSLLFFSLSFCAVWSWSTLSTKASSRCLQQLGKCLTISTLSSANALNMDQSKMLSFRKFTFISYLSDKAVCVNFHKVKFLCVWPLHGLARICFLL